MTILWINQTFSGTHSENNILDAQIDNIYKKKGKALFDKLLSVTLDVYLYANKKRKGLQKHNTKPDVSQPPVSLLKLVVNFSI